MEPPSGTSTGSSSSHPSLKNPRFQHISRSAAKRESVQLLGSIKDLQAHFSRAGLVERRPGSGVGVRGLEAVGEDEENRPPELEERKKRERKPWKEVEFQRIDIEAARKEARGVVRTVRGMWGVVASSSNSSPTVSTSPTSSLRGEPSRDTRTTLATTAQSIRFTRTLALSISHISHQGIGSRRVSTPTLHPPHRPTKGRSSFSTPSRPLPRAMSYGVVKRKSSLGSVEESQAKEDALTDLRKAAIEVLGGLRGLEEELRIHLDPDVEEEKELEHRGSASPLGAASVGSSSALDTVSTDLTSYRPPSSNSETTSQIDDYLEEDNDYSLNALAQTGAIQHHETWEERILSEDRQYRELEEEEERVRVVREFVRRWIMVVDRIFSVGAVPEDEGVAEWAVESWDSRPLGR